MLDVQIEKSLFAEILAEADSAFPLETGGVLLGWKEPDCDRLIISAAIGPGPDALHRERAFVSDASWQNAELAKIYEASGRRVTYLGDWHTHPNALEAVPSNVDKRCLKKVALSATARCSNPLMIIFAGYPSEWKPRGWLGRVRHRGFLGPHLTLDAVEIVISR